MVWQRQTSTKIAASFVYLDGNPKMGRRMEGYEKSRDFRPIFRFISEIIQNKTMNGHAIIWRWISQKRYETYTGPTQECHFEWSLNDLERLQSQSVSPLNAWPATGRSALQDLRSCAILQASLALSPVSSSICCTHVRLGRPRWPLPLRPDVRFTACASVHSQA